MKRLAPVFGLCLAGFASLALADTPTPSGLSKTSKDPIAIEADSLQVFDKESKAIYSGNVVVTQGTTVMKAQKMVIFYAHADDAPGAKAQPEGQSGGPDGTTSVKRVEAEGGVVIIEKDQVATGDQGIYDGTTDIITMTGNVALSRGPNVTKGQKLVYNLGTGIANVDAGSLGRVSSSFVSGGGTAPAKAPSPPSKPGTH